MSGHGAARLRRFALAVGAVACVLGGPTAVSVAAGEGAPVDNLRPEVSAAAQPRVGERVVCGAGSWAGIGIQFKFEWVREGETVGDEVAYFLKTADAHHTVWCIVTATNSHGSAEAESFNSICLEGGCNEPPPELPYPTKAPEITGTPAVGKALTCTEGEWGGTRPMTATYKWLKNEEPIASAEKSTYTVSSEDVGSTLTCRVTETNSAGSASDTSSNKDKITGSKPVNTKLPEVIGIAAVGQTLTCEDGEWTGEPPPTFEYQWLRNGSAVAMETGSTYEVKSTDEGDKLSCEVTARNSEGSAHASSKAVTIEIRAPESTAPPVISPANPEVEQELTCSTGSWTPAPEKYKYQWYREKTIELTPEEEGRSKYKTKSTDVGHAVYCDVTAIDDGGKRQTRRFSEPVVVREHGGGTEKPKPVGGSRPAISGKAELGQELACSEGEWEGKSPITYQFQWVRDAGEVGREVSLEGATSEKYKVTEADEGNYLSCRVTALNSEGTGQAESTPAHVFGSKPVIEVGSEVEISGAAEPVREGSSLTCLRGEWEGAPPPTFEYEWLRDGTMISTGLSHTVAAADRGHTLSCTVIAKNDEGEAQATSPGVEVPGTPPENTEPPSVNGKPEVGKEVECAKGKWRGEPEPSFTYQWLLNDVALSGATSSKFPVGSADRGLTLGCRVTATSREGSESATSKSVHIPGTAPEVAELPQVTGNAALGQTLTCERGVWRGAPPPTFTYEWLLDEVPIASANEQTYTVEPADEGHFLSCAVTATNVGGSVEVESINGLVITARAPTTTKEVPTTITTKLFGQPTAAQIRAAFASELTRAEGGAHIKSILKAGGFTFPFTAVAAGTMQLEWYELPKDAHGAKSDKRLPIARASVKFTGATKAKVKLSLTATGRQVLRNQRKHLTLEVKAVFSVSHGITATWYQKTFVLPF